MSDEGLSLADVPAGRELGDLLLRQGEHLDDVCGAELVAYVEALHRQVNCLEALRATAVNELAYCPPAVPEPDTLRTETRSELVPGVIEAALGWSRGWARRFDNVAYLLTELFPATHAALAEGLVDLPAARVIAEGIAVLDSADVRAEIEAMILTWLRELYAQGRRVTTQTVARHVEEAVIEADPAAAKKRHKDRVSRRDFQLKPNVDSAADLTLYDLPADVAVRIYNRIDATAKALKRHGDQRRIGQLRADIAASLLLGESRYVTPDTDPDSTDSTSDTDNADRADSASDTGDSGNADNADSTDSSGDAAKAGSGDGTGSEPAPAPAWRAPIPVRARNVLHVSLTALLGLHEWGKTDPAVLGGFGPVIDEVAERVLASHLDNPDARFDILVTHPRTGKPLQLHPVDARLFTGRLRDAVGTRWTSCVFPSGCSRPAEQCVIDHSHDYALGGKTVEANADPICPPHEREKTRNGWRQRRDGRDWISWIDPFGNRYPVESPTYGTPDPTPEPEPPPDPGVDPPPF